MSTEPIADGTREAPAVPPEPSMLCKIGNTLDAVMDTKEQEDTKLLGVLFSIGATVGFCIILAGLVLLFQKYLWAGGVLLGLTYVIVFMVQFFRVYKRVNE